MMSVIISACNVVWLVFTGRSLQDDSYLSYVICVCLRIVGSNTDYFVLKLCFSLFCIPYVTGCPFLVAPSLFCNVYVR